MIHYLHLFQRAVAAEGPSCASIVTLGLYKAGMAVSSRKTRQLGDEAERDPGSRLHTFSPSTVMRCTKNIYRELAEGRPQSWSVIAELVAEGTLSMDAIQANSMELIAGSTDTVRIPH